MGIRQVPPSRLVTDHHSMTVALVRTYAGWHVVDIGRIYEIIVRSPPASSFLRRLLFLIVLFEVNKANIPRPEEQAPMTWTPESLSDIIVEKGSQYGIVVV